MLTPTVIINDKVVETGKVLSEDELEKEKDKIEKSGDINEWLNDSGKDAGLISYAGDLKKKF